MVRSLGAQVWGPFVRSFWCVTREKSSLSPFVTGEGSFVSLRVRIQEQTQKKHLVIKFIWRIKSREKQEYTPKSWGMGRPRGSCAEGTTGSLFYMEGDEKSLSEIQFQIGQVESFWNLGLLDPQVGWRDSGCVWSRSALLWHGEACFL